MNWALVERQIASAQAAFFSEPVRLGHDIVFTAIVTLQPDAGWGYGFEASGLAPNEPQPYMDIARETFDRVPGLDPGTVVEIRQRNYRIGMSPTEIHAGLMRIPLVEVEEANQWRR